MDPPDKDKPRTEREARHLELFRATAAFEHATLRVPYLLNGGALVATLTFLGNIASKSGAEQPARGGVIIALLFWTFGLFLAGVATHYGYLSQHNFLKAYRRKSEWLDDRRRYPDSEKQAADHTKDAEDQRGYWKVLVVLSLTAFAFGSGSAIIALTK
jgi:hypothetical protein